MSKALCSFTLMAILTGCVAVDGDSVGTSTTGAAISTASYAATRYPIVLTPGIFGFRDIWGVIDYFPGIPEVLAANGADVRVISSSLMNSTEHRAELLIHQIEDICAITGAERVNLISHSQGAIEARYIAAHRPDLIASVTSVAGPHRGAPVADFIAGDTMGEIPEAVAWATTYLFVLLTGSSEQNDVDAAMSSLSTAKMAEFNRRYPAALPESECGEGAAIVNGIHYYSWTGVGKLTNPIDLLDILWPIFGLLDNEPNDGLVGQCSAHLGRVIRDDYFHNHIDQTNMMFGLVSPLAADPVALYLAHANRLKNAGL